MITREQYGEWRNHPATQFYRQFLKDRANGLTVAATEAWLNGDDMFADQEARGRIRELLEVEAVNYDTIAVFYQERDNARETTADNPL
jgi:hypothetical protein